MCGGGGGNQTSTSTTNLDPELKKRYLALLDRGEDVADLPYVAYGGPRLADFTADQQAAFAGIRDASGIYGADLDKAREYAGIAAAPMADTVGTFDADALSRYGDPFNQAVIDATIADIGRTGELARRDLDARAGVGGGIGAYGPSERATLERSEQWRDQSDATARAVAQLRSQNFAQAQGQFNTEQNRGLAARQNDAARAAGAANQYTGIAGAGQDYALRDAGALYGIGATQQGQAQRGLDIGYADFLEQRGYPKEQVNFLSGVYRGYPTTTSTTTTAPGANPWAQGAGLGLAALGAFGQAGGFGLFRDGGIVGYRRGGPVSMRNVRRIARKEVSRHNRDPRAHPNMADGGVIHSGVMRQRMSRDRGIAGYQMGGPVDVYGGLSNEDLGRLVDQGDMNAYDEYVRRLTTGQGDVTQAAPSMGGIDVDLPEVRDVFGLPGDSGLAASRARAKVMQYGMEDSARARAGEDEALATARGRASIDRQSSDAAKHTDRRNRPFELSDLGISGLPSLKVPSWVPPWDSAAEAEEVETESSYSPSMATRGAPGQRRPVESGIAAAEPAVDMEADDRGIYMVPPRKPSGIAGIAAPGYSPSPSMATRGGIADAFTDDDVQSIAKQVGGASADEGAEDAPAWSMPLIAMGLSMAASRNPSVLGAIGEGGIAGISSYIGQKRADAAAALEQEKLDREDRREDRKDTREERRAALDERKLELQARRDEARDERERMNIDRQIKLTDAQIARYNRMGSGSSTKSSFQEKVDTATAYYRDEVKDPNWRRKTLEYARSAGGDEFPEPTEFLGLPEDPDDLEAGSYYTTPQGRAKYLGNDQWELFD